MYSFVTFKCMRHDGYSSFKKSWLKKEKEKKYCFIPTIAVHFILKAHDPSQAIEETKALAAQSLASVTYQINSLACTLQRLLDSQAMQMKDMESSVNLLSLVRSAFPKIYTCRPLFCCSIVLQPASFLCIICESEALHTVLCSKAAAIHFEKVARREIGAFTSPKTKTRSKMLTPPPSGKEPVRGYSRMPISYSILDSIGHCFQVTC